MQDTGGPLAPLAVVSQKPKEQSLGRRVSVHRVTEDQVPEILALDDDS